MKYEIRTLADIFNKVPVDKIELCMAEIAAAMVMGKGTLGMMEITGQWPDVVEWIDDGAGNVGAEIVIGDDVLEIESRKIPFFSEKSRIAELEAENQALRVDAERYRFMRVKACIIGGEFQILNMPSAGSEWRQKYDAAEQLDAAIDAANMIKKKLLVPLPVAMWGETHEERYCKKCGLNMCNHFWMASRGGGYVVCPT